MVEEETNNEDLIKIEKLFDTSGYPARANVTYTKYANLAYVNASGRDIHINFLEVPGIRKDNEVLIDTTRIYMTHSAAQRLATVLLEVLDDIHSQGAMEEYNPEGTD